MDFAHYGIFGISSKRWGHEIYKPSRSVAIFITFIKIRSKTLCDRIRKYTKVDNFYSRQGYYGFDGTF